MGTDVHSQPGSTTPQVAATGTASAWFDGRARVQKVGGTNAVMQADSTTPSTRKGMACTQIATKIVAKVSTAGRPASSPTTQRCATRSRTTPTVKTSMDPNARARTMSARCMGGPMVKRQPGGAGPRVCSRP